ncbi:MAG TPA: DEAD/DEAH box helicase, partial [Polyangiaceae bacterium]|nr:DEAD/DEAH box helicase [Polyangiaceae bacterium]
MIPALVASEIRETLLDYLRTTWALSDRNVERALFDFLQGKSDPATSIFRGPYLRVRLPFAPKPPDAPVPLDIQPPYDPFLHQLQAWQRLSSRDGAEPAATLVTTGTGSGKTECFIYPILDHCHRALQRGEGGVKAIVLYPMNALASDQARRIAEIVHGHPLLNGKLRVGMYIGEEGQHPEMGVSNVIDTRDALRRSPPDILLTNYRMLDYLLLRHKDQALWKQNRPGTLRYMVLDELHTYDGAQGTDVACLLRRLAARLGGQDSICPVGTSATVASDAGTGQQELLEFATKVFDQPFEEDSVIGETRRTPDEFFALFSAEAVESYPTASLDLEPEPQQDAEAHVRGLVRHWFPRAERLLVGPSEAFRAGLGQAVMRHPLGRAILRATSRHIVDGPSLDGELCQRLPTFAQKTPPERDRLVTSMLSLLSWSQRQVGPRTLPLVQVQVQLWVREVRRLLREVATEPRFVWRDDHPDPGASPALPMYHCRECGHSGWIAKTKLASSELEMDYTEIARAAQQRSEDLRYLHTDPHVSSEPDNPLTALYFNRQTRRLDPKAQPSEDQLRLYVHHSLSSGTPRRDLQRCPSCDTLGALSFLASRSASLASVCVGHLYTTPLNTDRKLLAFSDSVQDASHRAGFFSGRTYRFSIRSAMLAVVPEEGPLALSELAPAMFEYWSKHASPGEKRDPEAAMIAAFLPHDLAYLAEYQDYVLGLADLSQRQKEAAALGQDLYETPPRPSVALMSQLQTRMRWEGTREFGLAARIGRTLERSGCASITVETARFAAGLGLVTERVPEKLGVARDVGPAAWRQFIAGLCNRVRQRGGIYDDLLDDYVDHGGEDFHLRKQRKPLLSPFGQFTTRPVFLTHTETKRFDNLQPKERGNWYTDWLRRSLGIELPLHEARDVFGTVMPLLVQAGIFMTRVNGNRRFWGLEPSALVISRRHAWRACNQCGYEQPAVAEGATDPLGQPCPRYRCDGTLAQQSSTHSERAQHYYRRFYEQKALGRVWSREHTGLLKREDRENLEFEFKERPRPDAANMLSCTPTLEMGIDIGDLSATMLCSVPPSTASYLQRVGRAGRSTGNALILTFATTQPHDLHFYDDPEAVMAGSIRPPGCYLDAPEVLKRQALAYCLDRWAMEGHSVPGQLRALLSQADDPGVFPGSFLRFVHERREALRSGFFEMFDRRVLRLESRGKLLAFFSGDAPGASAMERGLVFEIEIAKQRRDELKKLYKRAKERLTKLQTDETAAKAFDDPELEKLELKGELGYLRAELGALMEQPVWAWLSEASLLPNYAFPEAGVKLRAFVRRERTDPHSPDQPSEEFSWMRAPASAISELAPFNTFYGSGRKVRIDNIDLERGSTKGEWQFCAQCHHMEPVAELGETPGETCPACHSPGWAEKGRRRTLVRMTQVRAFTRQRDAVVSDETEDRERAFYETHNFYDPTGEAPRNVWANQNAGFGFELLPALKLRRINFGLMDARVDTCALGGREVAEVNFLVCEGCGQVEDPRPQRARVGKAQNPHRGSCPFRDKKGNPFASLHLYRELESEAIRLMVPVVATDPQTRVANLRAALRLGLKEFYGGDPEFLNVESYDEPTRESEAVRRHYLLIQDLVPGGTGLLAELTEDKGAKLKRVFELAQSAIDHCSCRQRQPPARACYRCLFGYREQRDLHRLERTVALDLLDKMLDAFDDLLPLKSVGELSIESILESELEQRFRQALIDRGSRDGFVVEPLEHEQLRITLGGRSWRYQPQVPLDEDEVLHRCRPDFMIYPEGQEPDVRAVAGFADGMTYHVRPNEPVGNIHDDYKKRAGIVSSGKYVTWSFGWQDIDAYLQKDDLGPWLEGNVLRDLERIINKMNLNAHHIHTADPIRALMGYLLAPREWPQLAGCVTFAALSAVGRQAPLEAVQRELEQLATVEKPTRYLGHTIPGADTLWARVTFGAEQEVTSLLSVPRDAAKTVVHHPERVSGVLRISDTAVHRSRKSYLASWRMFL